MNLRGSQSLLSNSRKQSENDTIRNIIIWNPFHNFNRVTRPHPLHPFFPGLSYNISLHKYNTIKVDFGWIVECWMESIKYYTTTPLPSKIYSLFKVFCWLEEAFTQSRISHFERFSFDLHFWHRCFHLLAKFCSQLLWVTLHSPVGIGSAANTIFLCGITTRTFEFSLWNITE